MIQNDLPASEASKEVANISKIKNLHTPKTISWTCSWLSANAHCLTLIPKLAPLSPSIAWTLFFESDYEDTYKRINIAAQWNVQELEQIFHLYLILRFDHLFGIIMIQVNILMKKTPYTEIMLVWCGSNLLLMLCCNNGFSAFWMGGLVGLSINIGFSACSFEFSIVL